MNTSKDAQLQLMSSYILDITNGVESHPSLRTAIISHSTRYKRIRNLTSISDDDISTLVDRLIYFTPQQSEN